MPVLLILKQARSTRIKPTKSMATMAPMIAPKGTEVSCKGGKVEYSPDPEWYINLSVLYEIFARIIELSTFFSHLFALKLLTQYIRKQETMT